MRNELWLFFEFYSVTSDFGSSDLIQLFNESPFGGGVLFKVLVLLVLRGGKLRVVEKIFVEFSFFRVDTRFEFFSSGLCAVVLSFCTRFFSLVLEESVLDVCQFNFKLLSLLVSVLTLLVSPFKLRLDSFFFCSSLLEPLLKSSNMFLALRELATRIRVANLSDLTADVVKDSLQVLVLDVICFENSIDVDLKLLNFLPLDFCNSVGPHELRALLRTVKLVVLV